MEDKLGVHCAQIAFVAANMGGVVTQLSTALTVARANAVAVAVVAAVVAEVVVMLALSSAHRFSIKCLNIEMMEGVPAMGSTHIMLSLQLLDLSMALEPQGMLILVRGSLRLS